PQPEGPSRETNSPFLKPRSTSWTTVTAPNRFTIASTRRKSSVIAELLLERGGLGGEAGEQLDHAHRTPGDNEGDDRERGRLIGGIGADELHVGAEGRPVEEARNDEFAHHDGKGQEGARQHGNEDVGQDDPGEDRQLV